MPGGCYANYNPNFQGPIRINGGYGSGDLLGSNPPAFLDKNAFLSPASFTYGNTPRSDAFGIYNLGSFGQDVSLRRIFPIHESVKLTFQADAFNVFNQVMFRGHDVGPATKLNVQVKALEAAHVVSVGKVKSGCMVSAKVPTSRWRRTD